MWWEPVFVLLIFYSTFLNYFVSFKFDSPSITPTNKKAWLVIGLALNLVVLGFFKYFGFFNTLVYYTINRKLIGGCTGQGRYMDHTDKRFWDRKNIMESSHYHIL